MVASSTNEFNTSAKWEKKRWFSKHPSWNETWAEAHIYNILTPARSFSLRCCATDHEPIFHEFDTRVKTYAELCKEPRKKYPKHAHRNGLVQIDKWKKKCWMASIQVHFFSLFPHTQKEEACYSGKYYFHLHHRLPLKVDVYAQLPSIMPSHRQCKDLSLAMVLVSKIEHSSKYTII